MGLAALSLPPVPSPCPSTGEHLVYTCCQKQDTDSERGALTEGGGGGVINRERRTSTERRGQKPRERESRDPEVGGDRDPEKERGTET